MIYHCPHCQQNYQIPHCDTTVLCLCGKEGFTQPIQSQQEMETLFKQCIRNHTNKLFITAQSARELGIGLVTQTTPNGWRRWIEQHGKRISPVVEMSWSIQQSYQSFKMSQIFSVSEPF